MSKKEKKINKGQGWGDDVQLDIPEDEIWTYQVPGLAAPHINKPYKYAGLKKVIFAVVIIIAVSLSMYFSVRTVQSDTFEYVQLDSGYQFKKFSNNGYIYELDIDYCSTVVYDETNNDPKTNFTLVKDETKPITKIREFALNCDEKVKVINIGAEVLEIDGKAFYSCWALQRIEVDENNPNYCDVDGVLYNKDKTEIICIPTDRDRYLAEKYGYDKYDVNGYLVEPYLYGYEIDGKFVSYTIYDSDGNEIWNSGVADDFDGETVTVDAYNDNKQVIDGLKIVKYQKDGEQVGQEIVDANGKVKNNTIVGYDINGEKVLFEDGQSFADYEKKVLTYVIPSTVHTVGELCFNYANMTTVYIPEGLKTIGDLGFYEIPRLANIYSYVAEAPVTDTTFKGVEALGKIYLSLPEGLEHIGSDAFTQCQALTYMYVPASVKTIEHHAFWDTCYKQDGNVVGVNVMNLGHSEEEFKSVVTGDNWRPQYDYLLFKKSIDINYSAEREQIEAE